MNRLISTFSLSENDNLTKVTKVLLYSAIFVTGKQNRAVTENRLGLLRFLNYFSVYHCLHTVFSILHVLPGEGLYDMARNLPSQIKYS